MFIDSSRNYDITLFQCYCNVLFLWRNSIKEPISVDRVAAFKSYLEAFEKRMHEKLCILLFSNKFTNLGP